MSALCLGLLWYNSLPVTRFPSSSVIGQERTCPVSAPNFLQAQTHVTGHLSKSLCFTYRGACRALAGDKSHLLHSWRPGKNCPPCSCPPMSSSACCLTAQPILRANGMSPGPQLPSRLEGRRVDADLGFASALTYLSKSHCMSC